MGEVMDLEVSPPLASSLEHKFSALFFKGGESAKTPPNTSQEKAAAEVALQRYQRYIDIYRPLENAAIADVTSDESANRVERWAGNRLNADAAQTMAAASPLGGMDPSGQVAQMGVYDPSLAASMGQGAAEVSGLGRKQKIAGLDAAIGIGTGQAKEAQLAFNDLAGASLENAIKQQELSFNARANRLETYGSAAGTAIRGGMAWYDKQQEPKK